MKKENKFLIGFGVLVIILAIVLIVSSNIDKANQPLNYNKDIFTTKSSDLNLSVLDSKYISQDYIKGNPNAPVTIVEFSDFQCPFCAKFYADTYKSIEEEYILTGKVKFVYRDFPLSIHPFAEGAAVAAECAGLEGSYYQMHNMLYDYGVSGNKQTYLDYAKTIGLDEVSFQACINSDITFSEIKQDFKDGQDLGVTSTPSFFINGEEVIGAQPYSVFKEVIDRKLNE